MSLACLVRIIDKQWENYFIMLPKSQSTFRGNLERNSHIPCPLSFTTPLCDAQPLSNAVDSFTLIGFLCIFNQFWHWIYRIPFGFVFALLTQLNLNYIFIFLACLLRILSTLWQALRRIRHDQRVLTTYIPNMCYVDDLMLLILLSRS